MSKFKNKLAGFFYGRYGNDTLNKTLTAIYLVWLIAFSIVDIFVKSIVFSIIGWLVTLTFFVLVMRRMMSRNIYARRKENERFVRLKKALKRFFTLNTSYGTRSANRDGETLIFRDCTYCGSVLRLPRRKGRNKVKCPRCSKSFYVGAGKYKQKKK